MRDPHPHPGPTVVDKPELRATFGGKVLFEASADGKKLEPTQARAYVRFLRYFTGGYPGVLAELQAEDRVPTTVTVHQFNAGKVQETRLTLVSLESSPEEPSPPVQHSWPVSKPVDSALNLAETLPPNPPDVGLANIPTLLREHQNLSAVLRAFENALCCGNALTPLITAHIAELQQDPACARFFQAVQGGATSPQASLDQMRGLEQEAGDTAFVLHVFEGGFLMQNLHQGPAGLQLYLDALNVQPRLAGAWKDVGDYYYHSYDTDTAWRCWDLGRHLAPQHSMLSSVNRLEAHLRQDYPEFF
jgi:hypothetical protein